jgi:hypothetical protein
MQMYNIINYLWIVASQTAVRLSALCAGCPLLPRKITGVYLILLSIWTANGGLPGGTGTTISHNTQKYTYHTKQHTTLKQNTAHKATQTLKDTLQTMDTTEDK